MYRTVSRNELIEATEYRQFILAVLKCGKSEIPRGRLSLLSRQSSLPKSFCSELVSGKRELTSSSFLKIQIGLKLPKDLNTYFTLLVGLALSEIRITCLGKSESEVHKQMIHLKNRLKKDVLKVAQNCEKKILSLDIFYTFAALGSPIEGATFEQIMKKINVDPVKIQQSLSILIDQNWVYQRDNRYFAVDPAIDLSGLGENHSFLTAYSQSCTDLATRAQKMKTDGSKYFLTIFPISPERSDEFKTKAQDLLLELADEFQDDLGQELVRVTLGVCS